MLKHHEESIEKLVCLLKEREGVVAIILGGSVAKGTERPDSDIDAMVVLDDDIYERYAAENKTVEAIHGECTYEGGYFDIKYMTKNFLQKAAECASEPTRNSFVKSRVLYSTDEEIEVLINKIGQYPIHEKQDKIISFLGYIALDSYYFWDIAVKDDDLFMKVKTASELVHFGLRLILAHNETLYACARRLTAMTKECEKKPVNILQLANDLLTKLDTPSKDAFVMSILTFTDWGVSLQKDFGIILARYTNDNEQWWLKPRPLVAEW